MTLPQTHELLNTFRAFLSESGLSKVSVKNYVSDVRKFIEMDSRLRGNDTTNDNVCREANDHVLPSPSAISKFVAALQDSQVPHSTINRYLASLRRYSVFLKVKYEIDVDTTNDSTANDAQQMPTYDNTITALFLKSLQNEDLSHSTVKNYKSDLNHFLAWSANTTNDNVCRAANAAQQMTDLSDILSPSSLDKYQDHLKIEQTSSSVINRRISTLKKFVKFSLTNKLISEDPFQRSEIRDQRSGNPLAFFRRFSRPFPVIASGTKQSSIQNADGSPRRKYLLAMTSGVRNLTNRIKNNYAYRKYNALPFVPYLHLAILVLFVALLANFGYDQIVTKAVKSQAYPASPTRPTRQLSFQGRLTDSSDTPITVATDVVFKLYNALSGGSQLYTSGTCSVTPDQDGIFNTLIGDTTCGAEIDSSVFSENQSVYMEVTVGASTLTPRQQIATVGYALNTETLQGYPVSSTASATRSTVAVMNQFGEVILGEQSPVLKSVSGTFNLQGQTLSLSTASTTNGNINLSPDGTGSINAVGGATSGNFLRITDANLTSGNLISGYVGNNTATGNLLSLSSGSSETTRLAVGAFGQTTLDAAGKGKSALIVNQIDSGPIFAASASGTNKFLIANSGDVTVNGGRLTTTNFTMTTGGASNYVLTSDASGNATWQSVGAASIADDSLDFIKFEDTLDLDANLILNQSTYTWVQNFTGTTTAGLTYNANSLTSGTALALSSTSTALSSGSLATFDWSPGSSTTATGDLVSINIGTNGNIGNLFNVKDTGSSLFSVSETAVTSNLPTSFTSSGDVSIAYDLNFTNPVASYIKSAAPLYVTAGETYNSSDLKLGTYNKGNIVANTEALVVNGSATVSGQTVIGTTTAAPANIGGLYLTNAATYGKALAILNQTETQDILTGSASGTTRFSISSGGNLTFNQASIINTTTGTLSINTTNNQAITTGTGVTTLGGNLVLNNSASTTTFGGTAYTWPATQGSNYVLTTNGSGTLAWNDVLSLASSADFWNQNNGLLFAKNSTVDFSIGGQSTASAKFAFINVNTGTPTASISGNSAGRALSIDGLGNITTTAMSPITIGSASTGPIALNPKGSTGLYVDGTGQVGIGTTGPGYKLDVSGTGRFTGDLSANGNIYIQNNNPTLIGLSADYNLQLANAGMGLFSGGDIHLVIDSNNNGTTHKLYIGKDSTTQGSETALMVVEESGNVGIGTTTPSALLDVAGNASSSGVLSFRGTTDPKINILNGEAFGIQTSVGGDAGLSEKLTLTNAGNLTLNGGRLTTTNFTMTTGGAANYVLTSDASGNATWATIGAASITDDSLDFTKFEDTLDLDANLILNQSTYTWTQNFTGTTTTGLTYNANSLSSGTALALSSTSTALTSGSLSSVDWSPGSATTATGDLVRINIGTNGTVGNLFNVLDTGSSLFSISETAVTSNLPTSFTSSGDVSMAYDLNFTNPTASYIKSLAPLYIEAGESFNSSDLTLKTYNKGNIVANTEALVVNGSATVSGQTVIGTTTAPANIGGLYLTNAATYGKALAILNQTESADIFTASASGVNKFVITSAGSVGIGTATPDNTLDLVGTLDVSGTTEFNNIAYTWPATQTNTYILQTNGSGTLSWIDPNIAAASTIYWNQANGSLFPKNSTVDAFIGGQATSSAKFAFLNVNSGTPTASISGNSAGRAISIDGLGNITTTAMSPITIGSASTGPIALNPKGSTGLYVDGTGQVGIGTTAPSTSLAIYNGNDSATLTDFTQALTKAGINIVTDYTDTVYTPGLFWSTQDNNSTKPKAGIFMKETGSGSNLLFGTSNLYGTGITNTALYINHLGNVGIGTTAPAAKLDVTGTSDVPQLIVRANSTQTDYPIKFYSPTGVLTLGVGNAGEIYNLNATADFAFGSSANSIKMIAGNVVQGRLTTTGLALGPEANAVNRLDVSGGAVIGASYYATNTAPTNGLLVQGNVGIGTTGPDNTLDIVGTLDVSGTTEFNNIAYTWPATQTNTYILQTNGSGTLSWVDPNIAAASTIYWNQANGSLFPKNSTVDAFIGGQATSSAKFAFLNVNSGTPTASISGNSAGRAISIDGLGNITTTAKQSLTLGDSSTGNIILNAGNVGIGTTSPGEKLDIAGNVFLGSATERLSLRSGDIGFNRNTSTGTIFNSNARAFQVHHDGTTNTVADYLAYQVYDGAGTQITANALVIRGDGNVGIGTTVPGKLLDIQKSASAADVGLRIANIASTTGDTASIYFQMTSNMAADYGPRIVATRQGANAMSDLAFWTTNSGGTNNEVVRIKNDGNVGIGTTGPGKKLTVFESGSGTSTIRLQNANNGFDLDYVNNGAGVDRLDFNPGAAGAKVTFLNSGNVGIGTTGPGAKLNVVGADSSLITLIAGATKAVRIGANSTYAQIEGVDITGAGSYQPLFIGGSELRFTTSGNEKMRLSAAGGLSLGNSYVGTDAGAGNMIISGNVGIGTTGPSDKLDVRGNITLGASLPVSIGTAPTDTITYDGDTLRNYGLTWYDDSAIAPISGQTLGISAYRGIRFFTSGVPVAVINGSGNVGIGTTSPLQKLQLNVDPTNTSQPTAIYGANADPHTALFISGTGNAINEKLGIQFGNYNNGAAAQFGIGGIYSVATSLAGSTIGDLTIDMRAATGDTALTEVMRIKNTGNVGIGTTGPGYALEVYKSGTTAQNLGIKQDYPNNNIGGGLYWNVGGTQTGYIRQFENGSSRYDMRFGGYNAGGPSDLVTIQGSGNVGIGTTNPTAKLYVTSTTGNNAVFSGSGGSLTIGDNGIVSGGTNTGSFSIQASASTNGNLVLTPYGVGGGLYLNYGGTASNGGIKIFDGASTQIGTWTSAGNVGIGTTGPDANLRIQTAVTDRHTLRIQNTATNPSLTLAYIDAPNVNAANTYLLRVANAADKFVVYGDGTTYMAGNVGIGTIAPSVKLHVVGNCVTGDTLLPIRRRRKKRKGDIDSDEDDGMDSRRSLPRTLRGGNDGEDGNDSNDNVDDFDEFLCPIRDIQPEDQVLSLNEATGTLEYSKINKLMDMGIKEVYELITKSGRTIRTTAAHPFLTLVDPSNTKYI